MIVLSAVGTIYFFGGWHGPFSYEINFILKILFFMILFVVVRAVLPRYRYDQLMAIGWRSLLPMAMSIFLLFSIFFYLTDSFYLSAQVKHSSAIYYLPDMNFYLTDHSIYMLDETSRLVYTEVAELSKFNWSLNESQFLFRRPLIFLTLKCLVVYHIVKSVFKTWFIKNNYVNNLLNWSNKLDSDHWSCRLRRQYG
jgi:hypothetical protein